MGCSQCGLFTQIVFGAIFIVLSMVMLFIWPSLYSNVLNSKLLLTNDSQSFELWKETPIPMYLEIFLYNFTNYEEVSKNPTKVKPFFEEKGPYVFDEKHIKVIEQWNENGTITFKQQRIWKFEPTMSKGSLSDKITNINVVAVVVANYMRDKPWVSQVFVDGVLKTYGEKEIVTKTAEELIFEGYDDPLLDDANKFDVSVPFKKFGWFYGRNLSITYDGVTNMDTGAKNLMDLGKLYSWNYEHQTKYYDGDCGIVSGSTGELFPPGYDVENITIFATDICSSLTLRRDGDVTIKGIQGTLFVADDWSFDNGHNYTEQKCYCRRKECQPWGTRDVETCKFGAPAFISYPHFYLSDPYYLSKVDGLVPNRENDEFKIGLEIGTGIPILVKAQLQINVLVEHVKHMTIFKNMPDMTYVPMLWFRQEVKLTEEYARLARIVLQLPGIVEGVFYAILAIGILLVGVALFVLITYRKKDSETQVLINNE